MSLEGMIIRFRGLNKEQMIAKYNSKNCKPMWTPTDCEDAKNAMKMLLNGEIPNEIIKEADPLADIMAMPDNPPVVKERVFTEQELLEQQIAKADPREPQEKIELPEEKFTMKRKNLKKK